MQPACALQPSIFVMLREGSHIVREVLVQGNNEGGNLAKLEVVALLTVFGDHETCKARLVSVTMPAFLSDMMWHQMVRLSV
jgi:hypothetical protein